MFCFFKIPLKGFANYQIKINRKISGISNNNKGSSVKVLFITTINALRPLTSTEGLTATCSAAIGLPIIVTRTQT